MRFEGTQLIDAPTRFVRRALSDPMILEASIPHCTRSEIQPEYHPELDQPLILGFEVGEPDASTGAEPIIGWLELTPLALGHGVTVRLTLDDGVNLLRAFGSVRLTGRNADQRTELYYALDAHVTDQHELAWSPAAIAQAELQINAFLEAFTEIVEAAESVVVAPSATPPATPSPTNGVRVLVETKRGTVAVMDAGESVVPTQAMLRRVRAVRNRQIRQTFAQWSLGSLAVVVGTLALWRMTRALLALGRRAQA